MIETMIIDIMEFLPYIGLAGVFSPGGGYSQGAFKSQFSPFADKGTNIDVPNPGGAYGSQEIDTSNIDFGDKNQVMNIQKALGVTADGQFGPKTEEAYRGYINSKRESEGKDAYGYGTEVTPDAANINGPQNNNTDNSLFNFNKESIGGGADNGYGINGPPINDGTYGPQNNNNQVNVPPFLGDGSTTFDPNDPNNQNKKAATEGDPMAGNNLWSWFKDSPFGSYLNK